MIISPEVPVHSGLKTASDVRVITDDTPTVKTPFEGSVKGVQCGRLAVAVVTVGRAKLMICLASIIRSLAALPRVSAGLLSGESSTLYVRWLVVR
jgi:hypothetical protein